MNTDSSPVAKARRSRLWESNNTATGEVGQKSIAEFIRAEVDADPDARIALNGPWGSGKTRILSLVAESYKQAPPESRPVVAWYDPWKYSPDPTVLRRTILESIAQATESQCAPCKGTIARDRYFTERTNERPKDSNERLADRLNSRRDFAAILREKAWFYGFFGLGWLALFLAASWLQSVIPAWGNAPAIFVAGAGAALLAALVTEAVRAIQLVDVPLTVRSTDPKLDQIDQFETEYTDFLRCLAQHRRNLVILVDDLDRCQEAEIRFVMAALSTYLEARHEQQFGRVAFVVAMDEDKIVRAMRGQKEEGLRQNIIQKTFHQVIPVPVPTDKELLAALTATLDALQWKVEEPTRKRMVHLLMQHGESNLRLMRAAVAEAHWLPSYYERILKPQGITVNERLIRDPLVQLRVALIRETAEPTALRTFLASAHSWLKPEPTRLKGITWDLFDLQPRFVRDSLDPRPLLGFGAGLRASAAHPKLADVTAILRQPNNPGLDQICEGYQPEALLSLVSLLISAGLPKDASEGGNTIAGLISIMVKARPSLDRSDLETFKLLHSHLKKHVPQQQWSTARPADWVLVAQEIGAEALDDLLDAASPLLQGSSRDGTLNAVLTCVQDGKVTSETAIRLFRKVLGDATWDRTMSYAVQMQRKGKLIPGPELCEVLITTVLKWNYGGQPEGPPRELFSKENVAAMTEEQAKRAAGAKGAIPGQHHEKTREFSAYLSTLDWPVEGGKK